MAILEMAVRPYLSVLVLGLSVLVFCLYRILWLRPETIRRALGKQGIRGPQPLPILGNILDMKRMKAEEKIKGRRRGGEDGIIRHDHFSSIFPYFDRWRQSYGPTFMFSIGNLVAVYVGSPDLVNEICLSKSLDIGKPEFLKKTFGALLGRGILTSTGSEWAVQRKIIAAEFSMGKVKGMMDIMVDSALPLLNSWEARLNDEGGVADMKIDEDLKSFTADVISRACFGSDYSKGEEIFSNIIGLQKLLFFQSMFTEIPGSRYLPTKRSREIRRLGARIRSLIQASVEQRKEEETERKDFLQSLIENATKGEGLGESLVIDNCKSIYFAGQETTCTAAKWALVLLASNPEWQSRVREEVTEVCGGCRPNPEMLRKMAVLTLVVQETLRLYPPGPMVTRQVHGDLRIGDLTLPKDTLVWIPILSFHRDPELWGADASQFKPERFAQGMSGACKHPHTYMPFGVGARTCLGQHFAVAELKTILAMILVKFRVSVSPKYCHSVAHGLVLEPEHGVHLVVERV